MEEKSPGYDSRRTTELSPSSSTDLRERIFLAALITVSSLSTAPFYRLIGHSLFDRLGTKGPVSDGQLLTAYLFITITAALILFGEGIVGLRAAKRCGLSPTRFLWSAGERLRWREKFRYARRLAYVCVLIAIALVVPQFLVYGMGPRTAADAARLSRHRHVIEVLSQLRGWRSLPLLYFGAPIREEIEFRLLMLSGIVWIFGRIFHRSNPAKSSIVRWVAVVLSGLAFGFSHVVAGQSVAWWRPIYQQMFLDPRTYMGIVLGWAFWKHGIETSIATHVTMNVIIITAGLLLAQFL